MLRTRSLPERRIPAAEGGEVAASQWQAMVDDGAQFIQSAKGGSERILNQDEIDSLLGFSLADISLSDNSGIRAIIDSAMVSYERLPMLEIVFDRLVRLMTTSLRNFTSDNVEVSLDRITSVRFGDYLNSIPLPAILAVFKAEEWDNFGLITVELALIYSIIDVLLGGRRGQTAIRVEGRPYTTIETNLVKRMIEVVLADAELAFKPLSPVDFRSIGWRPIRASPRSRGRPMRRSWYACASTWKTAAATSSCCCPMPPSSPSAKCCCRCSWARNSAAIRSGKGTSRPRSVRPKLPLMPCFTRKPMVSRSKIATKLSMISPKLVLAAVAAIDEPQARRHLGARAASRRGGERALRRRHLDRRPHGAGGRPGGSACFKAAAQTANHVRHCVILNSRLKRLRADEHALKATISELITAPTIAGRAVAGLKATAQDADRTLGERLKAAERLSDKSH